ncbi:hypothetical protein [Pseudomonas sp. FP2309]|uniref:hypothetical protein n=1 Tax=Pseudomonas sp. FP2309 TaxID=2954091 RepID=UPI00273249F7|nr:hypothetical protein [Pseudomonas sp. FP2309]WLH69947.1 hypothetical protein PSH59_07450 [Pseudomonas sp. FP2309]
MLFSTAPVSQQPLMFWGWALGVPFLGWCVLSFARVLLYLGKQHAADGWDEAREYDLLQRVRQGRRALDVLSVSLRTALRKPDESPAAQLDALLGGVKALKAQPARRDSVTLRHSRLAGDVNEDPEPALLRTLGQLFTELVPSLKQLPDETPLAVLLEVESGLLDRAWGRVWQRAWRDSGIRQKFVVLEGSGLHAVDQWLDERSDDQALLLVIAVHFAPKQPEATGEVVVGLLLGNRLMQTTLPPVAVLHRPELEQQPSTEALHYAVTQALNWGPVDATSVRHVWRAGIEAQRHAAINTVLGAVPMSVTRDQGIQDLDTWLGYSGKAAPWLAIAAATHTMQGGAGPQFIFSGGGCADAGLWSTAMTPVLSLSK